MKKICRKGQLKRTGKRLLALLLCVCLIGTMSPISARAETGEAQAPGYEQEEANDPVIEGNATDIASEQGNDLAPSDDADSDACMGKSEENDGIKGETVRTITAWEWIDEEEYLDEETGNQEAETLTVMVELGGAEMYESAGSTDAFTVTDGTLGTDYTYADGVLTIKTATAITIANTDSSTATTDRIEVASGVSADITLAGVNIDVSSSDNTAAFKIADNSTGNVNITLADGSENMLRSGKNCAGLQKKGEYSETLGKLTIQGGAEGTGKLTAIGGEYGAGIGGGFDSFGSNIIISGGTVTATGGWGSAGIGGGDFCSGSNITISGGTAIATGGLRGAGIGGGDYGTGSNITISGGTVTATGGEKGAGIGGGYSGSGSNIIIGGGSVKAVAGAEANTIGGGRGQAAVTPTSDGTTSVYLLTIANPDSQEVLIDGVAYLPGNHKAVDSGNGNLYAYLSGTEHRVQVGNKTIFYEFNSESGTFEVTPLEIKATNSNDTLVFGTDYTYENGVLTIKTDKAITIANTDPSTATTDRIEVASGVPADITLAGVNIDVSSLGSIAAFKIADDSTGNVTITLADGSENTVKSGSECAGLQKKDSGYGNEIGKLTIQGGAEGTGKLTANGGRYGAGIGGGFGGAGSNITISGGTVIATGGNYGAGIGSGNNGTGSNITISGGTVTATGGFNGAGIGGGFGTGTNITISGGTVTATGGRYGAGIGGGNNGTGSNITISGGTVTATGGENGAGIGGGKSGSGSNIKISGGSVKAVAGAEANVIGGGAGKDTVTPTLADGATTVYLLTIANPDGEEVFIDDVSYTPVNHKAVDSGDGNLYAYLTGKIHEVKVGEKTCIYGFDSESGTFEVAPLEIKATNSNDTLVFGTDYTYENDVLIIKTNKAMTIANTDPTMATTDRIEVAIGISADITLAGVNIDVSSIQDTAAFKIADDSEGNVTITLADGSKNTLISGQNCAGLQKKGPYISNDKGKLTIQGDAEGTGELTATGGRYGAGIGGGNNGTGSNITISGGTITATGGENGAGIGGGKSGSGSNIKISGGSVKAVAGAEANVIGGGAGMDTVTPTLADGATPVYLLTIANPDGEEVFIDDVSYTPVNHKAVDSNDGNLYAYLPAKGSLSDPLVVKVGTETTDYIYDNSRWLIVPNVTAPAANDLVYTGEEQALVTAGTTSGGAMVYSLTENGAYTTAIPKGKNASTYTVWYEVKGDEVYANTLPASVEVTIAKAAPVITIENGKESYTKYLVDEPFKLEGITANSDEEEVQYRVTGSKDAEGKDVAEDAVVTVDEEGTVTIHGAGTADIVLSLPESTNYHAAQEKTVSVRVIHVPTGLWIKEISDRTYNGKQLKPGVEVYYDRQLLTAGKDYTVSYKNNTNAAAADAVDAKGKSIAPTVIVKGKGNFTGTVTKTFTIQPINLDDYETDAQLQEILTIEPVCVKYTGKVIEAVPTVKLKGKPISLSAKQYTCKYYDENPSAGKEAYKDCGIYNITIEGSGKNFVGKTTVTETISGKLITKANIILDSSSYPYNEETGETFPVSVTVKDGKETLTEGTDYTVSYKNYDKIGTATVIITGIGNYSGVKTKNYKIIGAKLTAGMIKQLNQGFVYDGTEHSVVKDTDYTIADGTTMLSEGKNYTVTYTGNRTNAGTFKVTFIGIGNYSGTVTKNFTIRKASAKAFDITLPNSDHVPYTKDGAKPKPEVRFNGMLLTEGTDYTVTYKNNTKVASAEDSKAPYLYITGKGNFADSTKAVPVKFTIVGTPLDAQTMVVDNVPYKNKNNNFVPTVTITDSTTGKKLAKNTDYLNSFTYEIWDKAANAFVPFDGKKVEASEKNIRMRVTVSAKGNYAGTASAEYEICPKSILSVKVEKIPNQEYTGRKITPKLTITDNGRELTEGIDYTIEYSNNTNKGTATVTIRGKGQYGGSKTVKFKITSRFFKFF